MTNDEYIEQFWNRIKLLCKQNSISMQELSKKLGLGLHFVENAKIMGVSPKLSLIIKSSEIFNVSTDFLLKGYSDDFYQNKLNEIKQLSSF